MKLFALKTLLANRGKLITALIGVSFSLVLVCVQGGLFFGLIRKASLLIDHTDADIWIGRRGVENVDLPGEIPENWISRIRGLPGVRAAERYIVGSGTMSLSNGEFEAVWIVGSEPDSILRYRWKFESGSMASLRAPNGISVDVDDVTKLGHSEIGDVVEINGNRARIVAKTKGTQNFMTTPMVFTTLESARRFAGIRRGYCSYYLVKAHEDVNLEQLCETIRARTPHLDVFSAKAFQSTSQEYWMKRTGIGISFGGATFLGILVGFMMVGQSLYALALDHLEDYATLKAIGADDRQVCYVVLLQSLCVAAIGSLIGTATVFFIQNTFSTPLVPIEISPALLLTGITLAFVICVLASILPLIRIRRIDPVIVLQG